MGERNAALSTPDLWDSVAKFGPLIPGGPNLNFLSNYLWFWATIWTGPNLFILELHKYNLKYIFSVFFTLHRFNFHLEWKSCIILFSVYNISICFTHVDYCINIKILLYTSHIAHSSHTGNVLRTRRSLQALNMFSEPYDCRKTKEPFMYILCIQATDIIQLKICLRRERWSQIRMGWPGNCLALRVYCTYFLMYTKEQINTE